MLILNFIFVKQSKTMVIEKDSTLDISLDNLFIFIYLKNILEF